MWKPSVLRGLSFNCLAIALSWVWEKPESFIPLGMYAVLTLDSYTVRNHFKYCTLSGVGAPRVYKDAFDALKYLHGFAGN